MIPLLANINPDSSHRHCPILLGEGASCTLREGADHPTKFGGMDVSEAKRLKTLEDENARLKRLLADAMLDNAALKDLLGKKW
jgi:hypothetical protein